MVAAKDVADEHDDEEDPDVLFNRKYEPDEETLVVETQVLRDGRLHLLVRRKRKGDTG